MTINMLVCGQIESPTSRTPSKQLKYNTWHNDHTHTLSHALHNITNKLQQKTLIQQCTHDDTTIEQYSHVNNDDMYEWLQLLNRVVKQSNKLITVDSKLITPIKQTHTTPQSYSTDDIHTYKPSNEKLCTHRKTLQVNGTHKHKIRKSLRKIRRSDKFVRFNPVSPRNNATLDLYQYHNNTTLRENNKSLTELFDTVLTMTPCNNTAKLTHDDILQLNHIAVQKHSKRGNKMKPMKFHSSFSVPDMSTTDLENLWTNYSTEWQLPTKQHRRSSSYTRVRSSSRTENKFMTNVMPVQSRQRSSTVQLDNNIHKTIESNDTHSDMVQHISTDINTNDTTTNINEVPVTNTDTIKPMIVHRLSSEQKQILKQYATHTEHITQSITIVY